MKHRPTATDVFEGRVLPQKRPIQEPSPHPPKRLKHDHQSSETLPTPQRPEQTYYQPTGLNAEDEFEPSEEDLRRDEVALLDLYDVQENPDDKPIFALSLFAFFDPSKRNGHVSLNALLQNSVADRQGVVPDLACAGCVVPQAVVEDDDEIENDDENDTTKDTCFVRIDEIIASGFDVMNLSSRFWIETPRAYYMLYQPSNPYKNFWDYFYNSYRISQLVIHHSLHPRPPTLKEFLARLEKEEGYDENNLQETLVTLIRILQDKGDIDEQHFSRLKLSPLLKEILGRHLDGISLYRSDNTYISRCRRRGPPKTITDNNILNPENVIESRISPEIFKLARNYFNYSTYKVVGIEPPRQYLTPQERTMKENAVIRERRRLWSLIDRAFKCPYKRVTFSEPVARHSPLYKTIRSEWIRPVAHTETSLPVLHRLNVKVNMYILVLRSGGRIDEIPNLQSFEEMETIQPPLQLHQLFWFAKVRQIDSRNHRIHIQWLEHSSETLLSGFDNPYELVFTSQCQYLSPLQSIVAAVAVHDNVEEKPPPDRFFVRYLHEPELGTFRNANHLIAEEADSQSCPTCREQQEQSLSDEPSAIKDGFDYKGHQFHLGDFVLFKPNDPKDGQEADIRQITGIKFPTRPNQRFEFQVTLCGRVCKLEGFMEDYPNHRTLDEREIYLTRETEMCFVERFIRPIWVAHDSLLHNIPRREKWVRLSPYHFYLGLMFPTIKPTRWDQQQFIVPMQFKQCCVCMKERWKEIIQKRDQPFQERFKRRPLKILDCFAGTGSFSSSIAQGSQIAKLGYAVEIVPSIAKTLKDRNPNVTVFNQDANMIYREAVKMSKGIVPSTGPLAQIAQVEREQPPLPQPEEYDILTAGFPCPPHSTLNMYRNVNDPRNTLMLLTLSEIELKKPKYVFLENVAGFVQFKLGAHQESKYRVGGGINQGGIKLVTRALLNLGYQVRFGLLQAGDYGTPQTRIRFFLIAAQYGLTLPEFPQPTHAFPSVAGVVAKNLSFKVESGDGELRVASIRRTPGQAAHPFVRVADAISDLPMFDMKHPRRKQDRYQAQVAERGRREAMGIPAFECSNNSQICGSSIPVPAYHCGARTRFQINSRFDENGERRVIHHLQHFTKKLKDEHIERLYQVKMAPGADYRTIPHFDRQWSLDNALSWAARGGFKKGSYRRLDSHSYFGTTVTNVGLTAKQSQVLHPNQKRMVTVREQARSQGFPDDFHFVSMPWDLIDEDGQSDDGMDIDGDESGYASINMLFRQIGNAVAWPVGEAIGRELRQAVLTDWLDEKFP